MLFGDRLLQMRPPKRPAPWVARFVIYPRNRCFGCLVQGGGRLAYTVCINSIRMSATLFIPPAPTLNQTPMGLALEPDALELRLLSHRISAGFPSPAADYCEEGLDLNAYLVRNQPATFMFTVKGDSMIHAGIQEGDKVVVDRALTPGHDDIVVAVVDGEYTIKRLYKHRGRVELRPENPAYPPIVFQEGRELLVWGVVIGVVRRYAVRG